MRAGSFELIFTQLLANLFSFTDSRTTPRCIFAETGVPVIDGMHHSSGAEGDCLG